MRPVVTLRDLEDLLRRGTDLRTALPPDALLTPSARDLLRAQGLSPSAAPSSAPGRPAAPVAPAATPGPDAAALPRVKPSEVERFFDSAEVSARKAEICDIGRRLWQRAYVDGNGGNISVQVAEGLVLCSPTLVSKGFMKPEDLCLVDLEGNQKAGRKRRTSELLMHLAIFKAQPKALACVHAHPPYATGFAVAGVRPPTRMIPEMELMCGEVPLAPYVTPGGDELGAAVAGLAVEHNTILMANHGVVAWGRSIEDAYFKMEILEAYCRTVLVTAQLGKDPNYISPRQTQELLRIKEKMGIPDARLGLPEAQLGDNSHWRPGVRCIPETPEAQRDEAVEELVRQVTEAVLRATGGQ
jgi:L-fuculose-phosphate aldolase